MKLEDLILKSSPGDSIVEMYCRECRVFLGVVDAMHEATDLMNRHLRERHEDSESQPAGDSKPCLEMKYFKEHIRTFDPDYPVTAASLLRMLRQWAGK